MFFLSVGLLYFKEKRGERERERERERDVILPKFSVYFLQLINCWLNEIKYKESVIWLNELFCIKIYNNLGFINNDIFFSFFKTKF